MRSNVSPLAGIANARSGFASCNKSNHPLLLRQSNRALRVRGNHAGQPFCENADFAVLRATPKSSDRQSQRCHPAVPGQIRQFSLIVAVHMRRFATA